MKQKIKTAFLNIYSESIKNPPKTLDGHIKNENGITNDYRGRAIYEFFQNAVDRAKSKIWIHLDKSSRTLTVANDGVVFSVDKEGRNYSDLESLCSINTSSKSQNESIGNKGVGFKSCWEYTQRVSVCSIIEETPWGFELHNPLRLDKIPMDLGVEIIEEWKNDETYKQVFELNGNIVPSFYFPLPIKDASHKFKGFQGAATVIQFHDLSDEKIINLSDKIREFATHQIFFVSQLTKLKDSNIELEFKIDNSFKKVLNTAVNPEDWLIESIEFKGEQKTILQELSSKLNYRIENPKIAIAFPLKQTVNEMHDFKTNFYCYLPTEVKCGFNILVHADFLLDISRKQIDFKNNPYNKKLLEYLAQLFVNTLQNRKELHNLSYFAKFLLPNNIGGEFDKLIKEQLFNKNTIKSILQKVYTKDRNWSDHSYSLIFNVIERWKRSKSERGFDKYFSNIYQETISHFCDPNIYIVPIIENDKIYNLTSLPTKDSTQKLFYKKENNLDINSNLHKELKNVSITRFSDLERDYFLGNGIVKRFNTIELLRAINNEISVKESESRSFFENVLSFVYEILKPGTSKIDRELFFNHDKVEYQISKIYLPCVDGNWHPAIQCYTGLSSNISCHFIGDTFFELDKEQFSQIIGIKEKDQETWNLIIRIFGVWVATLPLHKKGKSIELPFTELPKIKGDVLKELINLSINEWKNLIGFEALLEEIKLDSWFYDESNEEFAAPKEVFLFNDLRKRKCIAQEKKVPELKDLYRFLAIETIEDTEDITKLTSQLERMKALEVDDNHKTVYKQLVLRISRFKDNLKEIPLLLTNGIYTNETTWFAPYDKRKYVHLFKDYRFVNFDTDTALGFVDKIHNVNRFEPEFTIRSDEELVKDNDIKHFFESNFLVEFFSLAEVVISTILFDKEEAITRWNNLEILRANDVWFEVSFNNKKIDLYKGSDHDVLYKPMSKSERESKKESVGVLVHDLKNGEYIKNPHLPKFGFSIAEAIFRNQNFGDILSNFIQKKQNDKIRAKEYLEERGISKEDIDQTSKFIDIALVSSDEMNDFIEAINEKNTQKVTVDTWTNKKLYLGSFIEIKIRVIEILKKKYNSISKFDSLIDLISPYKTNLKFLFDHRKDLQARYFHEYDGNILSDDNFNNKAISKSNYTRLSIFSFEIKECCDIIEVSPYITPKEIEKAKSNLRIIDIKNELDISGEFEFEPKKSNGARINIISSTGKEKTYTKKTTYQDREKMSRKQHQRGIGIEKLLAIKYAQKLFDNEQQYYIKESIHNIKELKGLEITDEIQDIESLSKILQVSESVGDGLGYDVLEPEFDNGKLKYFNRVEIKSSKDNHMLYLSENERQKILYFKEQNEIDWKLYHFVNGEAFDRTESIGNAIKTHSESYNGNQLLVAENWHITFEE